MSDPEDEAVSQHPGERMQGEERLRFLAEASEILAATLDYEIELERIARLTVPALADWCVVDLLGEDGTLHRLAMVHRDPAKAEAAAELKRRYPILSPRTSPIPPGRSCQMDRPGSIRQSAKRASSPRRGIGAPGPAAPARLRGGDGAAVDGPRPPARRHHPGPV